MKIRIVHLEGSRSGQTEEVMGPIVSFGRDPSCQISFDPTKDDRVSGRHLQLQVQGQNVIVSDLGSKNGTFVNGQRVTQPMLLPPSGVIQLGEDGPKVMIQLVADAPVPMPPPAPVPPPPPPPVNGGGKKTCLIFGCIFLLLILVCGGGGLGYYFYTKDDAKKTDTPTGDASPSATPSATTSPAKPAEKKKNAWGRLPVGTVIEQKTSTAMKTPAMTSSSVMKWTIKDRDEKMATVELETVTTANGTAMPASISTQQLAIYDEGDGTAPSPAATKGPKPTITNETLEVPGMGKLDCEKIMVRETLMGVEKSKTETWIDKNHDLPFPVKMNMAGAVSTTKSEITKVTKPK